MRRIIQRQVENQLARMLLAGEIRAGDTVLVDMGAHGLTFERRERGTAHAQEITAAAG